MAAKLRVLNISNNCYVNLATACRAIESCGCAWVVEGETIRTLTPDEARDARIEQAKLAEPLPYAELPGVECDGANEPNLGLIRESHIFVSKFAVAACGA